MAILTEEELDKNLGIGTNDTAASARFTLAGSMEANPEQEARIREMARDRGVPVEVARSNYEGMKKLNAFDKINKSPALARFFVDKNNARIAHDDVDSLSKLEEHLRVPVLQAPEDAAAFDTRIPKALWGGMVDLTSGVAGVGRAGGEFLSQVATRHLAGTVFPADVGLTISEQFAKWGRNLDEYRKTLVPESGNIAVDSVYEGLSSFSNNLVTTGTTLLVTKNPNAALAAMGGMTFGQEYQRAREAGLDMMRAGNYAGAQGLIEVLTERAPVMSLMKNLKASSPLWKMAFDQLWKENVGEQAATHLQDLMSWMVLPENENKTLNDYLNERPTAAVKTVIATTVATALQTATFKGAHKLLNYSAKKTEAEQHADEALKFIDGLNDLARTSKVAQRDVESFQRFMESASEDGPIKHLYIDADKLQQSGVMENVARISPFVASQLPDALETKGSIQIPVSEYAAKIAPTEYSQSLLDHLKVNPDDMSKAEAADYVQEYGAALQAEVDNMLSDKDADDAFRQSTEAVHQTVLNELNIANRFTSDVNQAYASLTSAFYATTASKIGVMPEELFRQFPLHVASDMPFNESLKQNEEKNGKDTAEKSQTPEADRHEQKGFAEIESKNTNTNSNISDGTLSEKQNGTDQHNIDLRVQRAIDSGYITEKRWKEITDEIRYRGLEKEDVGVKNSGRMAQVGDGAAGRLQRLFHGTRDNVTNFDLGHPNRKDQGWLGEGVYLVDDPDAAWDYASLKKGEHGSNIMPLAARIKNPYIADLNLKQKLSRQSKDVIKEATKKLMSHGYDSVILPHENGVHEIVVFDPSAVRSYHAEFDPKKSGSSDLLAQDDKKTRGTYDINMSTISLLKDADLSTFLHETGHHFLEMTMTIASRENAPQSIRGDADKLLQWFGIDGLDTWNAMDIDAKRQYHEQFARGFEAYLFEGKSPNLELQGLFQSFRQWLIEVYENLVKLNVKLTDEVRGVMDRMLASDEQIQIAEQNRSMFPLLTEEIAKKIGMDEESFHDYQELGKSATQTAVEELQDKSLQDMQWLHDARSKVISQLQKRAAGLRESIRAEVADEIMNRPVYKAMQFLRRNEITEDGQTYPVQNGKLRIADVKDIISQGDYANIKKLGYGKYGMLAEKGLHPDVVAEMFGFTSGDHLIRELIDAPQMRDEIEFETDVRMLERHGNLASAQAIEDAADRAVHNDVRARMVTTEVNALNKAIGQRSILTKTAKQLAEKAIGRQRIRDICPSRYASSQTKAARAAEKAIKKGDIATAAFEKRNQLIHLYAAKASYTAREEVEKGLSYLRKFNRDIKGIDPEYQEQIAGLLERFDLRSRSLKEIDRKTSLAAWIESQRKSGIEPDIPDDLLVETGTNYKNLTVDQFKGLVDSVRQIEHLGRLKKKLLTVKDKREFAEIRDALAESIHENANGRSTLERTATTKMGRMKQGLQTYFASHIKVASMARVMDGGKDGGVFWNTLIRPANEAGDKESRMRAEATKALSDILAPVFKLGKMGGKGIYFKSIGRSLNREQRLAMALNMGNEGNIQRLLDGEGWTFEQIKPVMQSMTSAEWQAVQSIWDHIESYRPLIAAKEKRLYGREPEWVEVKPLTVTTADGLTITLKGGYYPIRYDSRASKTGEMKDAKEQASQQMSAAYSAATTRRSFVKARSKEVHNSPVLLSMTGLYSGVNEVIHDLCWHEWLVDANRLMRSDRIDQAIRSHYGADYIQQIEKWKEDMAKGDLSAGDTAESVFRFIRKGVSAAGLGFNVWSAIQQPIGITNSIVQIGAKWVGRGVSIYLRNPVEKTKEVNEKSIFMAERSRTRFRELNELRNMVQDQSALDKFNGRWAYWMMMRVQQQVDMPTWIGAYEKYINEGHEEEKAIAMADQAVIDSQGGGMSKDLSGVERGGPAMKLFTVFYSFMNTVLNQAYVQTMTQKDKAKIIVAYMNEFVIPIVLTYALKKALTPNDDDEEWDLGKMAVELLADGIGFMMGLLVGVRELQDIPTVVTGGRSRSYSGPVGLRLIPSVIDLVRQGMQGEMDDAFRKAAVNVVGSATGLPAAQINRTVSGIKAMSDGETSDPRALVFGYRGKK